MVRFCMDSLVFHSNMFAHLELVWRDFLIHVDFNAVIKFNIFIISIPSSSYSWISISLLIFIFLHEFKGKKHISFDHSVS